MPSILIAENEKILAKDLSNKLAGLGYEIVGIADSGEDAIRLATDSKPDLILMDIKLGEGISGIEAAERINEMLDIPIIYTTAYSEEDLIRRASKTKPYGYLSKPLMVSELRGAVEIALYKHQADQKIRISEARRTRAEEIAGLHIWEWDIQANRLYWSAESYRAFGLRPDDKSLSLETFIDSVHPDDRSAVKEKLRESLDGLAPYEIEFRIVRPDRQERVLKSKGSIERDPKGTPIKVSGVAIDITDFKKTDDELRKSEIRYRDLYENSPDMLLSVDAESARIIQCNNTCAEVTGYSKQELIGRHIYEIYHPDCADQVQENIRLFRKTGEVKGSELKIVCKDGTVLDVILNTKALRDEYGKILHSRSSWRNVTELKDAEREKNRERKKAENYLQIAGVIIVALDAEGRVTLINRRGCEVLGYESHELIGKPWFDQCVPESDRKKTKNGFKILMEGKTEGVKYFENLVITKEGRLRLISWENKILYDQDGYFVGTLSSGEDITERRKIEERLIKSEKNLSIRDRIAQIFLTSSDSELFSEVLQVLLDVTDSGLGIFGYVDEKGAMVCPSMSRTVLEECKLPNKTLSFPRDSWSGNWGKAFIEKKILYSNKPFSVPEGHVPIFNHLVAPIVYRDKLIGTLQISNKEGGYGESDQELMEMVTDYLAPILDARVKHDREENRRAEVEQKLKTSEEKYRRIVETANEGIWVLDASFNTTYVNIKTAEMLGYSLDEMLGKPASDFMFPQELTDHYNQMTIRRNKKGAAYERRYRKKEGGEAWMMVSATPLLDKKGNFEGSFAMLTDITERKRYEHELQESEERYRAVIDNLHLGISVVNANMEIESINPFLQKLYPEVQPGAGQLCYKMYNDPPRSEPCRDCPCIISWQDGQVHEREVEIASNNATRICRVISCPVKNDLGQVDSVIELVEDITERKTLRAQLAQAHKMEAIGTLAGGVAHDFNNILQVVLGYAELIKEDESFPAKLKDEVENIILASRSGAELVQRLLTFSRKTEFKFLTINLNTRLKQIQKTLNRIIPKMIYIELILDEYLAPIKADPTQIEQIILNLAVNARDAMPNGGRLIIETQNIELDDIYCKTHLGSKPGSYVLMSVTDTGDGMDQEILDHIFEPFYTTKATGEGTGLGLAMVYGIVKQHDGYIMCYSEVSKGTTFKIYFPAQETEEKRQIEREDVYAKGGNETILLVDDDEMIRDLGSRILKKAGYNVIEAANGVEALEKYKDHSKDIDVVILDLIMPKMGGVQCLLELLKMNPDLKVVIASGFSVNGQTKDALRSGAKGFINKPFNRMEMLRTLREVLDEK